MSNKTKNMIIYSVMTIVVALFLYAVFVGNKAQYQDSQEDEEFAQSEIRNNESMDEQIQVNEEETTESESNIKEHHEELEIEIPEVDTLEKQEGIYAEYFPTDVIEESQQTAIDFTKNYYSLNGNEPLKHIENAKPYMTSEMYQELKKETPRPTAAIYRKEVDSIDAYEPYKPNKEQLIWKVRVQGNVYDSNGNKTANEVMDYTIKTKVMEGTFKVENYMLNVPY